MPAVNRRAFFTRYTLGGLTAALPTSTSEAAAQGAPSAPTAGQSDPAAARQRLQAMLDGAAITQLVYVVARARIADHVGDEAARAEDLASAAGLHADALYRVMRALAGYGVFQELDGRRFRQSAISHLLRTDAPHSMRAAAAVRGEDFFWRSWGALRESVRTGRTGHEIVYGENTFDWFAKNPDAARLFDDFQAALTTASTTAITKAYPMPSGAIVADIGGGNGTLISAVLEANPSARGVLFDLPHVVEAARPRLAPLANRIVLTGGDFFKAVPTGANVYIMKYILHDWEEPKALTILANTRKAMPPRSVLLVIEDLVCGPNAPCRAKLGDVTMLARTGGRNMTETEYRTLLQGAGFSVSRVIPVDGDLHIIESRAA